MIGGHLNLYQIPTVRTAYASNGYNAIRDESNSVIIFNNRLHTNSVLEIENFSKRLYNLDRIIDVNANAQKTPVLLSCNSETQRLTLKNLYMKFEGNEPVIYADNQITPDSIKVLRTDAPYVADKIYELKTEIWNEALTYLGIANTNFMKKERMVVDEVVRNMGGVIASRYSKLLARRQAAEQINRMFGLNIEVDFRSEYNDPDIELELDEKVVDDFE